MTGKRLFIFGFGFSARAIAEQSSADFDAVCGTSRSRDKIAGIRQQGLDAEIFDGIALSASLRHQLVKCTHLLISIAPGEKDPVLSLLGSDLESLCPHLQWIGYLSTVGVYGNHDGDWVDEDTEPRPVSKRSVERLAAEQAWTKLGNRMNIPIAIFRLSGIYGPGRNAFITVERGKARRLVKPGQVFNRIHCEDIATAVSLAMRKNIGGIFNVTDNEPAPPQDVVTYAHQLMGKEPPPEIDFETAEISQMARSFYGENKRVSNARSKKILGMVYNWPDYRVALARMWETGSWRPGQP